MKKTYKITDPGLPKEVLTFFGKRFVRPQMEVKSFNVDKEMIIEGIANAAIPDRCDELIMPEAWDFENYKKNPIILLEHDRNRPIGVCLDFSTDKNGLHFRAQIGNPQSAPLTEDQVKARSLLAQGILRTNSVGFLPRVIEWDEAEEIVRYTDVELLEISVVSIPMQQDSIVTSVKSFEGKIMSQVSKSEDSYAELKSMVGENTDCTKKIHDMVEKMMKAEPPAGADVEPDEDDKKSLKDQITKLLNENTSLKSQILESEQAINELCDNLEKQGLIKGEKK
jgi:HK97 family phage prohead protease